MNDFVGFPIGGDEVLFEPGEDFHGYIVEKLIGKGGLGSVWLVYYCRPVGK